MIMPDSIERQGSLVQKTYTTAYEAARQFHDGDVKAGILAALAVQYPPGQRTKATTPSLSPQQAGLRAAAGEHSCATCYFRDDNRCHITGRRVKNTDISDFYLFEDAVFFSIPDQRSWFQKWRSRPLKGATGFKVVTVRNRDLWIAWYSNPYRDREGEYFAEASLDADIEYMQSSGDYPELWFYHIPGTAHGKAHYVGKIGRMVVAIGEFVDTPFTEHMKRYYQSRDMRVSHGYLFNRRFKRGGVYYLHHTYEVSPLPPGAEANPYTGLFLGETLMNGVDEHQMKALMEALNGSEELANLVAESGLLASAKLEELGVDRKSKNEADDEARAKNLVSEAVKEALAPTLEAMERHTKAMTDLVTVLAQSAAKGRGSNKPDDDEEEDEEAMDEKRAAPVVQNPQIEAVIAETKARQDELAQEGLVGGAALVSLLAGRVQNGGAQ